MVEANLLVDEAIELAKEWLETAETDTTKEEQAKAEQLSDLIQDPDGIIFAMRFIDNVARPQNNRVAGQQLSILGSVDVPGFLSPTDRLMFATGARLSKALPHVVVPLALKRLRSIVGDLVVDADPKAVSYTHLTLPTICSV